jgi:3-phenylpropionate/cinnamic acid dioxygenase small subunit
MRVTDPARRSAAEDLFARFGAAIDEAHFDQMDELFAEDARWQLVLPTGDIIVAAGIEEIKGVLAKARTPGQTRHVLSNLRLDEEGPGSLTGRMYLTFCVTDEQFAVRTTGTYEVKISYSGSSWRFVTMSLKLDSLVG